MNKTLKKLNNCPGGLVVTASLKLVIVSFPLRIIGIALQLTSQFQNNELGKHWLKIVQETWICELSPLNN